MSRTLRSEACTHNVEAWLGLACFVFMILYPFLREKRGNVADFSTATIEPGRTWNGLWRTHGVHCQSPPTFHSEAEQAHCTEPDRRNEETLRVASFPSQPRLVCMTANRSVGCLRPRSQIPFGTPERLLSAITILVPEAATAPKLRPPGGAPRNLVLKGLEEEPRCRTQEALGAPGFLFGGPQSAFRQLPGAGSGHNTNVGYTAVSDRIGSESFSCALCGCVQD